MGESFQELVEGGLAVLDSGAFIVGERDADQHLAIVGRALWLVMFPRMSEAGAPPVLRQNIGITALLM